MTRLSRSYLCAADHLEDQTDFLFIPRHQELLGDQAKDCEIPVCIEKTGLEDRGHYMVSYVLFRCAWIIEFGLKICIVKICFSASCDISPVSFPLVRRFTPEFFQGCSVEEINLHSLQLYPLFTSEYNM